MKSYIIGLVALLGGYFLLKPDEKEEKIQDTDLIDKKIDKALKFEALKRNITNQGKEIENLKKSFKKVDNEKKDLTTPKKVDIINKNDKNVSKLKKEKEK